MQTTRLACNDNICPKRARLEWGPFAFVGARKGSRRQKKVKVNTHANELEVSASCGGHTRELTYLSVVCVCVGPLFLLLLWRGFSSIGGSFWKSRRRRKGGLIALGRTNPAASRVPPARAHTAAAAKQLGGRRVWRYLLARLYLPAGDLVN